MVSFYRKPVFYRKPKEEAERRLLKTPKKRGLLSSFTRRHSSKADSTDRSSDDDDYHIPEAHKDGRKWRSPWSRASGSSARRSGEAEVPSTPHTLLTEDLMSPLIVSIWTTSGESVKPASGSGGGHHMDPDDISDLSQSVRHKAAMYSRPVRDVKTSKEQKPQTNETEPSDKMVTDEATFAAGKEAESCATIATKDLVQGMLYLVEEYGACRRHQPLNTGAAAHTNETRREAASVVASSQNNGSSIAASSSERRGGGSSTDTPSSLRPTLWGMAPSVDDDTTFMNSSYLATSTRDSTTEATTPPRSSVVTGGTTARDSTATQRTVEGKRGHDGSDQEENFEMVLNTGQAQHPPGALDMMGARTPKRSGWRRPGTGTHVHQASNAHPAQDNSVASPRDQSVAASVDGASTHRQGPRSSPEKKVRKRGSGFGGWRSLLGRKNHRGQANKKPQAAVSDAVVRIPVIYSDRDDSVNSKYNSADGEHLSVDDLLGNEVLPQDESEAAEEELEMIHASASKGPITEPRIVSRNEGTHTENQSETPSKKATDKEPAWVNNRKEMEKMSPSPVLKHVRTRSWDMVMAKLANQREEEDEDDKLTVRDDSSGSLTRNHSFPLKFLTMVPKASPEPSLSPKPRLSQSQPSQLPTKNKPEWKSAQDPTTGRIYYYHRVTRVTTWTKPEEIRYETDEDTSLERNEKLGQQQTTILRRKSSRDFDPSVWKKKERILFLLNKMSPPDSNSVEKLMDEYDGKEDELLEQLQDMMESRPFDEPIDATDNTSAPGSPARESSEKTEKGSPFGRTRTRTLTTTVTRNSENTEKIANTTGRVRDAANDFDTLRALGSKGRAGSGADPMSTATSISSHNLDYPGDSASENDADRRFLMEYDETLSKKSVQRNRELRVETFSNDRLAKETFNNKSTGSVRRSRKVVTPTSMERIRVTGDGESSYNGDNDQTDFDSYTTDTVSALSSTESCHRDSGSDRWRRKALDEAIAREDWELAAAISEQMRLAKYKPSAEAQNWRQTELDRFISENDWDAVADYIARMRDSMKEQRHSSKPATGSRGRAASQRIEQAPRSTREQNPYPHLRKKIGSRSQLQHSGLHSVSSWESSASESEYTSATTSSDERSHHRYRRFKQRRAEFEC